MTDIEYANYEIGKGLTNEQEYYIHLFIYSSVAQLDILSLQIR